MGAPVQEGNSRGLSRYLPVLSWLPNYDRTDLRPDAMAAVTMAAFSIPELMAFAELAGLHPQYGLYAGIFAGIVYFLFGTIRHLVVGPAASQSVMVAGVLGAMAAGEPDRYLALAMMTSILVGIIFIIARMLK
ncbi:MAG: sulfate transporter, partial [Thermoplasmata archaeon]|nr:sulfate transporter [Thermoplasmata archaeon]NIS11726.1 sulfate transporter [Thermoplasmata archaeon]NIS19622.1 sulfate transporter [Thermoplasmata archaeon]NIT76790.1 sulfate transporter [Thermoplasmata archaeon]NIU48735.1 sulfate transporter [Thermoplasmata archaeon]